MFHPDFTAVGSAVEDGVQDDVLDVAAGDVEGLGQVFKINIVIERYVGAEGFPPDSFAGFGVGKCTTYLILRMKALSMF